MNNERRHIINRLADFHSGKLPKKPESDPSGTTTLSLVDRLTAARAKRMEQSNV